MNIKELIEDLKGWKLTKYKVINFTIGLIALFIYEFIGRPIYRPYIYENEINDFHFADTLGNTFGTMPTIFFLIAIFTNNVQKGNVFIWLGTLSVVIYEILQPLLGNPIDIWDILATVLTGFISFKLFNTLFKAAN